MLIDLVKKKKAVIFDLFHTLTDVEYHKPDGKMTFELLGVSREEWNHQLLECSRERLIGKEKDPYQFITRMARNINPEISSEIIDKAIINRQQRFERILENIPAPVIETIRTLKKMGKKIALISNADAMEAAPWERSPIAPYFDAVIFSCHRGYAKPEDEIYNICLKELGISPDEALFVGDGGSGELQSAQESGITTVMITGVIKELWPEKIEARKKHAHFIIEQIPELTGELNN